MPTLRRLRADWKAIDDEARKWSQGDLLYLPYVVRSIASEYPATPESLAYVRSRIRGAGGTLTTDADDVLLLEGQLPAVIVTQSCDLVGPVQSEPIFQVALVDRLPNPDEGSPDPAERERRERAWRLAVAGANTSRFAISVERDGTWSHETLGPGRWFVDLRALYPVEKGKLLQLSRSGTGPVAGVPRLLAREFALHLQERLGRAELPDLVDRGFFAPLVQRLRALRSTGTAQEQLVLNGLVREIRYVVEPADARNYLIQIYVCLSEECRAESAGRDAAVTLMTGLIKEFSSRAIDARVRPVRFVGFDLLEMSALEYRDSTRLNWTVAA